MDSKTRVDKDLHYSAMIRLVKANVTTHWRDKPSPGFADGPVLLEEIALVSCFTPRYRKHCVKYILENLVSSPAQF